MTSRVLSKISNSAASVPPLQVETVLPLILMLVLWIAFTAIGLSKDIVFVLVLVIGQSFLLWRNLPKAAFDLGKIEGRKSRLLVWPVAGLLSLAAIQLLIASPLFSQRLLSAGCLFVLIVMLLGVRREKQVMDRVATGIRSTTPVTPPVSLLRVNALFAAAFLCINEMLIATGSLTVWMTCIAVLFLVLRAAYWFVVLLVLPSDDTNSANPA
ncbi:MAG: hypothetical protein AAGF53_13460 [Pseudomonadota bacterium]